MAATRLIPMHQNKGKSIRQSLRERADYAENPDKTNEGELISAYECDPRTIDSEFASTKREYLNKFGGEYNGNVIAYQIRQSFKPGEITPEEANRVGYETAMRWTKGKHAFIVATHTDRAHIHNHIIYNSTDLTGEHKFRNFFLSYIALQKVSDLVCLENGYSVIKPKKYSEREKRTIYTPEVSFREKIRNSIDVCMEKNPKDMDELLRFLEEMGYVIKRGKHIAVRSKEQKTFIRFRSLGAGYRQEDLEKVFTGLVKHESNPNSRNIIEEPKLDMLIDIQEKISQGKGPGYERWAKVHNVKQMAQTLLFLEQHDLRDYDKLSEIAASSSERFGQITTRQKEIEARLSEIKETKKHIINYTKTKDVYVEYRKSGYSKKFFEEHREEITLHKAAKEYFKNIKGSIPKIKELNSEYDALLKEKKALYAEYKQAKQDMKDYQTAKYNVDQFLKREQEGREEQQRHTKEKNL